ncbi:hypothetical protein ACQZ6F_29405 [Rhizobium sp. A22-96]
MFEDEYSQSLSGAFAYNSWSYQYVLVIGVSIKCMYSQVVDAKTQGNPITTEMRDNITYDLNKLAAALKLYQSSAASNTQLDKEVGKRIEAATQLSNISGVEAPNDLTLN